MEVILREEIEKLGRRGDVVKVASGYARNFLLPKRMAVEATEANKKIVEQEKQAYLRKEAKEIADAQELGKMMANVCIGISQKAGENDQLFGSVTARTSLRRSRSRATTSTAARFISSSRSSRSASSRCRFACTKTSWRKSPSSSPKKSRIGLPACPARVSAQPAGRPSFVNDCGTSFVRCNTR